MLHKIGRVHKDVVIAAAVVIVVFAVLGVFLGREQVPLDGFVLLYIDGVSVHAEVVTTEAARGRGLSGRESLPDGQGMLFVFEKSDRYAFWMKEMHFPIDIIWLDENFTIVSITEDALPESYPATFRPTTPVRYVLEVPAGFVRRNSVIVGNKISFPDGGRFE